MVKLYKNACFYKQGNLFEERGAITEIARHFRLSKSTVRKYLNGQSVCSERAAEVQKYALKNYPSYYEIYQIIHEL